MLVLNELKILKKELFQNLLTYKKMKITENNVYFILDNVEKILNFLNENHIHFTKSNIYTYLDIISEIDDNIAYKFINNKNIQEKITKLEQEDFQKILNFF